MSRLARISRMRRMRINQPLVTDQHHASHGQHVLGYEEFEGTMRVYSVTDAVPWSSAQFSVAQLLPGWDPVQLQATGRFDSVGPTDSSFLSAETEVLSKTARMWINQPSTWQEHHALHGQNVLAHPDRWDLMRVFFLDGTLRSSLMPRNSLSVDWQMPQTPRSLHSESPDECVAGTIPRSSPRS